MSRVFKRFASTIVGSLLALGGLLAAGPAHAAVADPNSVSFTLEGCRNDGTITLPIGGKFVCPTSAYTSGNLGKGWNELDLVPHRLTARAGNSAPASQTYAMTIALDNFDAGHPGYDVLGSDAVDGTPVLNTALSSASCTALTASGQLTKTPGVGGIDKTIYRTLTITQAKNTTCVYDWYGRLALGSHLFPGSSLHANALNQALGTGGIGARDVSIPVKEISPQELRKTMTATADSEVQWDIKKSGPGASINFGDVCKLSDGEQTKQVTFRVEWLRVGTTAGGVTFITNIYAKNPASRLITVNVTDVVYRGLTQVDVVDTKSTPLAGVDVPANTELLVLSHTKTITDGSAGGLNDFLNDVATATYTDKATGVIVPGNTTATASAKIGSGVTANSFAAIADTESITGTGLKFSVAQPDKGAFQGSPAYVAGDKTVGPVDWAITGETIGRSVDFVKTIYLDGRRVTSGTIGDTAVLVANNIVPTLPLSPPYTATASASASISSDAKVSIKIEKTIPPLQLTATQRIEVKFSIKGTRDDDNNQQVDFEVEKTLTFLSGETSKSDSSLTALLPDTYTVTEVSSQLCDGNTCGPSNLVVQGQSQQTLVLTAGADGLFQDAECSGTASFVNIPSGGTALAQVQKLTTPAIDVNNPNDPNIGDVDWTFTLNGTGTPVGGVSKTVKAGQGYGTFPFVLQEGSYTVTETQKAPAWALTSASPDANNDKVCEFTVDYPADFGKTFSCTFNNTKQGRAKVVKTKGGQPLAGTDTFTFELRKNASTLSDGQTLETKLANAGNGGAFQFDAYLTPGATYQICEQVMPGWNTNLAGDSALFVPNSVIPPALPNPNVNNMTVCTNFAVNADQVRTFNVDNTPPPGGRALTIGFWKNWASCAISGGGQKPVLDQTLAKTEPTGLIVSADMGVPPVLFVSISLTLHGSTATPDKAPDCQSAVRLLNKSTINTAKKMASDPAFNMAAQLVAARLNVAAGAGASPTVVNAINQAIWLLGKYDFNGITHGNISATDATAMNNLAKLLDDYNNNR